MKKALLLLAFTPSMALATDRTFNCEVPNGSMPEMNVTLVANSGNRVGQVLFNGEKTKADIYPGLNALTFLMFAPDYSYTFNYNLNLEAGEYKFAASGRKSGWGNGTCTEVTS